MPYGAPTDWCSVMSTAPTLTTPCRTQHQKHHLTRLLHTGNEGGMWQTTTPGPPQSASKHFGALHNQISGKRTFRHVLPVTNSLSSFTLIIMATLHRRCGHYILHCGFVFFFFFFPRLISAVGDWISTILPHVVRP